MKEELSLANLLGTFAACIFSTKKKKKAIFLFLHRNKMLLMNSLASLPYVFVEKHIYLGYLSYLEFWLLLLHFLFLLKLKFNPLYTE